MLGAMATNERHCEKLTSSSEQDTDGGGCGGSAAEVRMIGMRKMKSRAGEFMALN